MLAPKPIFLLVIGLLTVANTVNLIASFMGLPQICWMGPSAISAFNHTLQEFRG